MISNDKFAKQIVSLKLLISLFDEKLDIVSLLYKTCLLDLCSEISESSIRNINPLSFYLKHSLQVIKDLYDSFLLTINDGLLCISFDGKKVVEKLAEVPFVEGVRMTCSHLESMNKAGQSYRDLYVCKIKNYTEKFLGVGR